VEEIAKLHGQLDAVVSSRNIAYCDQPDDVLTSMLNAIKPGGRIYLSFPCEESVDFPKRRGGLNFYDEKDHKFLPNWEKIIAKITSEGFFIDFAVKRHRPWFLSVIGLILEPISATIKRVMPAGSTWALYGFESVIWASRPQQ
jgi:SAM-dependent methyltransferase